MKAFARSIVILLLLAAQHVGVISAAAQTRRAGAAARSGPSNQSKPASQRCAGGWSGVVTLKKTLIDSLESDEPGIRKNTDRIRHKNSRRYEYVAKAVVDGKDPQTPIVNTNISLTDTDLQWGEERVFDTCNSRENGHWFIIEGTDNRYTQAQATGPASSFNLSVNESAGMYSFNMQFPDAMGTYKREQHVKRTGHCQPKNNEPYDNTENQRTKVDGEGISVYEKMNPDSPDTISGSKTWGDDGKGSVRTFVLTATWTFTRCPGGLLVTDIKFEDMRVPDWSAWKEVTENESTIDGNIVRVTAKVLNLSGETKYADVKLIETYKGDKWDGAKNDVPLMNPVSIRLEGGEEREVEWIWNTQGYAWYNDGRPRLVQRLRAEAWEGEKLKDSRTENIRVAPKPIVFVAGLWSSPQSFEVYQNLLTQSHSYGWKAAIFTRLQPRTGPASVYDNADDLAEFIKATQKKYNAWHVDMVAHSSGGLVGRLYVHKQMEILPDNKPVVKHLLMLGTPHLGVPCADSMKYNDAFGPYMRTAQELMPDEMARFNQFVTERKGTQFSTLVGNGSQMLCASWEPSDGFASVESARWLIKDYAYTSDSHPDLVDPKHFGDFMKQRLVTGPIATYPLFPGVWVPQQ